MIHPMDWRDSYRTRSLAFSFALVFYVPYGLHRLRTVPVLYSILISFNFYLIILDPGALPISGSSVLLVPRENSSPCLAPRVLFAVISPKSCLANKTCVGVNTQVWVIGNWVASSKQL